MKSKMSLLLIALFAVASVAQDASTPEQPAQSLNVVGSTTVGPIAVGYVGAFRQLYPNARITVSTPGSGVGARTLVEKGCDVAMMSRFMKPEEFAAALANGVLPVAHAVAVDGICVTVHPTNPVQALTIEQIRGIYAGEITNWSQVGGPNMEILAISRDSTSGTYDSFNSKIMDDAELGDGEEVTSNQQMKVRVAATRNAIGYMGYGFVDNSVKPLAVNGIEANAETITSGRYPISRPVFWFTNGYPTLGSLAQTWISFHMTEAGHEVIEEQGFVPFTQY